MPDGEEEKVEYQTPYYAFQVRRDLDADAATTGALRNLYPDERILLVSTFQCSRERVYFQTGIRTSLEAFGVNVLLLKSYTYSAFSNAVVFTPDVNDVVPDAQIAMTAQDDLADEPMGSRTVPNVVAFITPINVPSGEELGQSETGRAIIKEREQAVLMAAGLTAAVAGREFLATTLSTVFFNLETDKMSVFSRGGVALYSGRPELDSRGRSRLLRADLALRDLARSNSSTDQVKLGHLRRSLQWFARAAITESSGDVSENFLSLWIATEVLVSAEGPNVPIQLAKVLTRAFRFGSHELQTAEAVKGLLQLGQVYGVRKKLLHMGEREVSYATAKYLEDLYIDALLMVLGIELDPSELLCIRSLDYWRPFGLGVRSSTARHASIAVTKVNGAEE